MNATKELVDQAASEESASTDNDIVMPDYILADQIGHKLRRAHQRATSIFINTIGDTQLTPTQWAALVTLRSQGPMSQNQLGRLTFMDPATTQGVIVRLAERGLVGRTPDPHDRRRTTVRLTARGEALVLEQLPRGMDISAQILNPLTREERQILHSLLSRLM